MLAMNDFLLFKCLIIYFIVSSSIFYDRGGGGLIYEYIKLYLNNIYFTNVMKIIRYYNACKCYTLIKKKKSLNLT